MQRSPMTAGVRDYRRRRLRERRDQAPSAPESAPVPASPSAPESGAPASAGTLASAGPASQVVQGSASKTTGATSSRASPFKVNEISAKPGVIDSTAPVAPASELAVVGSAGCWIVSVAPRLEAKATVRPGTVFN